MFMDEVGPWPPGRYFPRTRAVKASCGKKTRDSPRFHPILDEPFHRRKLHAITMSKSLWFLLALAAAAHAAPPAFSLPESTGQCLVGIADSWDSSSATLRFYQKSGGKWVADGPAWTARLGREGLAWGRGLHPHPPGATLKKEGDWRAPAGVFTLGGVWGYDAAIRKHAALPYRKVTPRDLWVEDPASADYNRHVILGHDPASPWEKKQQMKQSDPAHALKLFIAHNAPPKVTPGGGSSIFFHIWRSGGAKPSAGCTTMDEAKLRALIARIDPAKRPLYVLLPRAEYDANRSAWKLP
jgi:L,D-peptidoglycan transpeptidase YkuD (ErfK/YbiS/YcfS/YnhG family)